MKIDSLESVLNVNFGPNPSMEAFENFNITAEDYLKLWNTAIYPNPENRGGADLNENLVKQIYNDMKFGSFNIFLVEQQKDGTFKLEDSHHRTKSLVRRFHDGLLTKEDLSKTIILRVVPYGAGFTAYRNLNSGKAHTSQNKLHTIRYFYGNLVQRMLYLAKLDINNNRLQTIANVATMMAQGGSVKDYGRSIAAAKSFVNKHINDEKSAKTIEFTDAQEIALAKAMRKVEFILGDIERVYEESSIKPEGVREILNSAPLYSWLLADAVSEAPLIINRYNEKMAHRVLSNTVTLKTTVSNIANHWSTIHENLYDIFVEGATRSLKTPRNKKIAQLQASFKNTLQNVLTDDNV